MLIVCPSTGGEEQNSLGWLHNSHTKPDLIVKWEIEGEAAGYLQKVNSAYKFNRPFQPFIAYFHSDLTIHEPGWDCRVINEFRDPSVAIVSFFGARQLGRDDIYKIPYHFHQLARADCYSNLRDAETHGQRFTESMDVAMIDSFSLIVRRQFLDEIGGFPMHMPPSHGSDMYLCMMAARYHKRVRLLGIDCSHTSGGVRGDGSFDYPAWAKTTKWGSDEEMHRVWHEYLYQEFRDVLPIRR